MRKQYEQCGSLVNLDLKQIVSDGYRMILSMKQSMNL
jgi:hypothetical protein